jgi:acrylyl-CoA reductase (NADPH)
VAVDILSSRGHEVVASSGKDPSFLEGLGAASVISRSDAAGDADRPLEKTRWAGAVDCVGGDTLAGVLRGLKYGAAVAASGNTGGVKLPATVLPFILRGVSLLGIDSVQNPIEERRELWKRLGDDLRPRHLDAREVELDSLDEVLSAILRGEMQGRTVVRVGGE